MGPSYPTDPGADHEVRTQGEAGDAPRGDRGGPLGLAEHRRSAVNWFPFESVALTSPPPRRRTKLRRMTASPRDRIDLRDAPFWAGYVVWLRHHRPLLVGLLALLLALFVAALWASRAPQDAFTYELF